MNGMGRMFSYEQSYLYSPGGDRCIRLSLCEREVMGTLVEHPGWIVTHSIMEDRLFDVGYAGENRKTYISRLRHKLIRMGWPSNIIETIPLLGTRLNTQALCNLASPETVTVVYEPSPV